MSDILTLECTRCGEEFVDLASQPDPVCGHCALQPLTRDFPQIKALYNAAGETIGTRTLYPDGKERLTWDESRATLGDQQEISLHEWATPPFPARFASLPPTHSPTLGEPVGPGCYVGTS